MRPLPRRLRHEDEATLVEHLGEFRSRLFIILGVVVVGFAVAYVFRGHLIDWLEQPLPPDKRRLSTFGVTEPFLTSVKVSFFAGFMLALPVIFWQLWSFLAPAFQEDTQRVLVGFVAFATGLLAAGLAFGYFVALPAAVHFLTSYDDDKYLILIRASSYFSFTLTVLLAVGLVFELPIFILALVRLRVLSAAKLRRNWRIGIVAMAVLAVALPGVDPFTTMIEMVPLLALYGLSVVLAGVFERRWGRAEDVTEAAEAAAGEW